MQRDAAIGLRGGNGRSDVQLLEHRPLPPLGHFSLVRFGKIEGPDA